VKRKVEMAAGNNILKGLVITSALLLASAPVVQAQRPHASGGQREARQAPPRQERAVPRPQQSRGYENQHRSERPIDQPSPESRELTRSPRPSSEIEPGVPQAERRIVPRPPENVPRPGHAGNWLSQYRKVPREQQERALESDPQFRKLPPERQQQLRQRLQRFSSLPPQQQDRILNRMETWEHLTPQQKQTARSLYQSMQKLPPGRREMVENAIRDLRQMPPDQRQQMLDSPRYRNMFTPQERNMLNGITQLPLAPANGSEPR
jgi:hypothetical protein